MYAIVLLLVLGHAAAAEPAAESQNEKLPACVQVGSEVRYGNLGYDHIVRVYNGCETTAKCSVATDVNPTAATVSIAPKQQAEVVTFRGSPAREFTANVSCELSGKQSS